MSVEDPDLSSMNSNYGSINTNYRNSTYSYGEIDPNYSTSFIPDLVDVGTLCNDEYSYNTFTYTQMWQTPDTISMCLQNAQKVINDATWEDETKIRNKIFDIKKGLNFIQMSANNYMNDDVTFFMKNQSISPLNNATITINAGNAVEIFGYFIPDVTGRWTFTLPTASVSNNVFCKFWISNNNALYDYTDENADINNNQSQNGNQPTFGIELTKFDVVPIRIHIITKNITLSDVTTLLVQKPDGTRIIPGSSPSPPGFVTITNNGQIYLKKTLYVALLSQPNNLYSCYFLDPTVNTNAVSLHSLKCNPKMQHIKTEIPTAVTYSGSGTYSQTNGSDANIVLPTGIPLQITSAQFGASQPYTYDVVTPYTTTSQSWVGPGQSTNMYNGSERVSKYTTGYTKTTQSTAYKTTRESQLQQQDVTGSAQGSVNQNQFNIPGSQYIAKFGNPIKDGRSNPQLDAKYTYSQVVTDVTNKQLYVDPSSGKLVIGYSYQGNPNSTPMPMDQDNTPAKGPYNYRIFLGTDATLQVQDTNGSVISKKDLSKYVDQKFQFSLNNCLVNPKWLNNPLNKNIIDIGKKLPQDVNELVSSDGRFKLMFRNDKLIFDYCGKSFQTNGTVKYTTSLNVDNGNQVYYLYRMMSRGLHGKKVLGDFSNKGLNVYYLPNTYNNVLKQSGYSKPVSGNVFPYINPDNVNVTYKIYNNSSDADCQTKCNSDVNCEHYFLTADSAGKQTCYADNKSNANPLYFSKIPSGANMQNGNYNKKKYKINTSCGTTENNQDIVYGIDYGNSFKPFSINYLPGENAQNLTYYCGLASYKDPNEQLLNSIKTNETFQNYREGMNVTTQINTNITPAAIQYSKLQDNINHEYNKKTHLLDQHADLSNNLASQKYLFNGSESIIPSLYINRPNEKSPEITLDDGMKRDTQILLLEQNRMFTLASISAVTFLILAVFLAKD